MEKNRNRLIDAENRLIAEAGELCEESEGIEKYKLVVTK